MDFKAKIITKNNKDITRGAVKLMSVSNLKGWRILEN